jgi:hypothetical protein
VTELVKRNHDSMVATATSLLAVEEKRDLLNRCSAFLREVSDYSRRKSIGRIEDTINSALLQIFSPRKIKAKIEFDLKAGRVGSTIWLTNEEELEKAEHRGGGIRDLVSVLLRVMFKKMSHPQLDGPLILDESIKFLHSVEKERSYVNRAYKFLQELTTSLGLQFIFITNNSDVQDDRNIMESIDRLFLVKLRDGVSHVKEIYDAEEEKIY